MKIVSPRSWSTTLLLDAMFYHAAQANYKAAEESLKDIKKAERNFGRLRTKERTILDRHNGDVLSAYDELEPIYISMESADYGISAAYGPHLQYLALTHILCAAASEAHINQMSKETLTGNFRDQFERVSLEGKWLFLPKMIGGDTFDQGAEPFQSFSILIKYRNELVHYKGKKENWAGFEQGPPTFFAKLGLSLPEAHRSLQTIKKMILELSRMTQREPPFWLRKGYDKLPADIITNFFEIGIEHHKESKPNKSLKADAASRRRAP